MNKVGRTLGNKNYISTAFRNLLVIIKLTEIILYLTIQAVDFHHILDSNINKKHEKRHHDK